MKNWHIFMALTLVMATCACESSNTSAHSEAHEPSPHEPELAEKMISLHYFQRKLGLSLDAKNKPLSDFYLHELEETMETIVEEVPSYEGFPIGSLTSVMGLPKAEAIEKNLDQDPVNWATVMSSYKEMITSCNACHQATEHGFIRILPAPSNKPFDQDFSPLE